MIRFLEKFGAVSAFMMWLCIWMVWMAAVGVLWVSVANYFKVEAAVKGTFEWMNTRLLSI